MIFKCCDEFLSNVSLQQVDLYIKNICKKFGVFVNIIDDCIRFNSQSVNEHLDMMFPGLGNRIHLNDNNDSIIEIPDSTMSHTMDKSHNSSPNSSMMIQSHPSNGIPPEKRFKFHNEFDSLSSQINTIENLSDCKQNLHKCITDVSGIINTVFDVNAKLDEELKLMEQRHTDEVNSLLKNNNHLIIQATQLKMEMHNKIELMKHNTELQMIDLKAEHARHMLKIIEESEEKSEYKLKNELKLIEEQHKSEMNLIISRYEQKIAQLETERKKFFSESYNLIERKQEEKERAVSQAIERCKRESEALINDAKGKKYCMACGAGKPLDLYYVCNLECQRRYW